MKAITLKEFGGPENLKITDMEKPTPGKGQVLIRASASSVNPVDYKIRSGAAKIFAPQAPMILQGDVAGVVEAVGPDIKNFKVGDEVYGCIGGVGPLQGALAQYTLAQAELLAHKPKNLSMREAAALPLVTITAWEALIDRANVQKGQIVLVHAGAGGVGHIGIQLAKARGAIVHATVSNEKKAQIARELGADQVINYREKSVAEYVQQHTDGNGYDIVFDTVGGKNIEASFEAAKLYGTVVSCQASNPNVNLLAASRKALTLHTILMLIPLLDNVGRAHHGEIMAAAADLVEKGQLRPLLDEKRFSFEEVGQAHTRAESGDQIGKVVVDIE